MFFNNTIINYLYIYIFYNNNNKPRYMNQESHQQIGN